jgi:hypothetical protein
MPTKKETIETVYFRPDGFGSLKEVLKDAKAKDDTITYEDVKGWKASKPFGQKAKPYGTFVRWGRLHRTAISGPL